jgi:ankyrin repeat protein
MDDPYSQRPQDPNMALLIATISPIKGSFDEKTLPYIKRLFAEGADPNYVSPLFGVTPLMRAVRTNSPQLVELLLQEGAKVNVSSPDKKFVRDFNLMHSRKKIVPMVTFITHYMLQIKTHNAMNPHKKINCRETICSMKRSQIIRNAAMIDKILEEHKAYSDILAHKHPLLNMLRDSRVKRALSYVFTHHMKHLPDALRHMLCNKGVARAASAPELFLTLGS